MFNVKSYIITIADAELFSISNCNNITVGSKKREKGGNQRFNSPRSPFTMSDWMFACFALRWPCHSKPAQTCPQPAAARRTHRKRRKFKGRSREAKLQKSVIFHTDETEYPHTKKKKEKESDGITQIKCILFVVAVSPRRKSGVTSSSGCAVW